MSLSSKTMTGALPPSSRCVRFKCPPALTATARPAATDPVIDTISGVGGATTAAPAATAPVIDPISGVGCATTAAPVFRSPQTTFSTPGGRWRDAISASITVVTGVVSLGLITTVLPAAIAGQNFQIAIIIG